MGIWKKIRVPLTAPLTTERFGEGDVIAEEIVLREPDAIAIEEIEALDLNAEDFDMRGSLDVAAILSGIDAADLMRLGVADLTAVSEAVAQLMGGPEASAPEGDDEPGEAPAEADGSSSSA